MVGVVVAISVGRGLWQLWLLRAPAGKAGKAGKKGDGGSPPSKKRKGKAKAVTPTGSKERVNAEEGMLLRDCAHEI